jgi:carbon storage regulator
MLVLTRRIDESIAIGDNIQITVLAVEGERVKLGISAPRDVVILRQEIYQAVQEQSKIQEHLAQEPESKGIEDLRKFLAEEVSEEDSTDTAEKKE